MGDESRFIPSLLPLCLSSTDLGVSDLKQIFTADPDTVEPLPRHEVLVHLETVSPRAAVSFLEFLIEKLGEKGAEFHDRLAELYLEDVKKGKKSVKEGELVLCLFFVGAFGLMSFVRI